MTTSLVEYALGYVKEFSKDNSVYFEFTEKNTFELLELLKTSCWTWYSYELL
ncbi:MAG: hypothetical protein ACLTK0_00080 [Anaerovoracaceae bacterium]